MTARHSFPGDRTIKVCDCDEVCASLVIADGPLAGRDVRPPDHDYQPRHDFTPPWPYVFWHHGRLVEIGADEDVRDAHDTRFPITGGQFDGIRLGGRW